MEICIFMFLFSIHKKLQFCTSICMYICMYVHLSVHMYVHLYPSYRTYVWMYVQMYGMVLHMCQDEKALPPSGPMPHLPH